MNVIFHELIKKDLRAALSYYDAEGGSRLGDRFFEEVEAIVAKVIGNPRGFHFVAEGLRRAALASFPYHFLYEEDESHVQFLVLRHDKRHPGLGMKRHKRHL
ncbi:MAG: type II toxin-antitoxin system RelE/ParE family toxin [Kiritimatiellia bacterium]